VTKVAKISVTVHPEPVKGTNNKTINPLPRKPSSGFTLLELLISLSIFAIISVVTFAAINYSFKVVESSKGKVERFAQVQITWHLISQDLLQIVSRPIRTDSNTLAAYIENSDENLVSFTRGGAPRLGIYPAESGLVRVSYKLEENNLYRITWPVLDRDSNAQPIRSLLLTEVDAAAFTHTSSTTSSNSSNSSNSSSSFAGNAQELIKMPQSIKVKLTLSDLGEIERIYPGVATIIAPTSTSSTVNNQFGWP
jgi:general secretion pathway protein J